MKPAKLKKLFLGLCKEGIIQKKYEQEQLHYDFVASLTQKEREVLMLKRNMGSWEQIKQYLKETKASEEFFFDLDPININSYEKIIKTFEEYEKKYQIELSDYTRYIEGS